MNERIQSLISKLEHDPSNEQAIMGLEEIVTSDLADEQTGEVVDGLDQGWRMLASAGRWDVACKVIDFELAITADSGLEQALLLEQARILDEEVLDQKAALEKYQKVLNDSPDHEAANRWIEAVEAERANWKELVQKFEEQAEEATEPSLKAHMLYSAAERTYKNHKRGKEIPGLLGRALEEDPSHLKAAQLQERVFKERERWEELAELYMKLGAERRAKQERLQMLLAAAYTYAVNIEDMDSAAICYAEVLDLAPGNETSLKFLVKYYEEREDWDHLVAVYEDALRGKLAADEEAAMLMQVGMVHWRMRESLDAAEEYFRRLRKLAPAHMGMLNFYRTWAEEKGAKAKLLQILTDAQRSVEGGDLHDKLTREIAELAGTEGGNVEKAIDAWKTVLRQEPDNAEAREQLKMLYRQSEKWNALLETLKGEAEALPDEDAAGKIAIYEEMVDIYRDSLSLDVMVIKTYDAILNIDPQNSSALGALTETYQSAGRWNDLIGILNRRAELTDSTGEKVELLNQVASLWVERFNNFNRAVAPLEEILEIDPGNQDAIDTLKSVYEKRRAWRPLLELLDKEVELLEGDAKRDRLVEMAGLAGDRLSDHTRAIELWRRVLATDPDYAEALPTLEKLTERVKDWDGLAEVIESRVATTDDDDERVQLLTKLGTVCKDRAKDPVRAADAWRRLLEVQPGNAKAMRSLKEAYLSAQDWEALEKLYGEAGDWEGLVEVLGIAADRTNNVEIKVMLSFRCAELYDDPIGQPDRAVRHYERVLTVDEDNDRAAVELMPIYRRAEKWSRLIGVLEVVLDHSDDADERVQLLEELREVASARLNNRALAFKWAARAFGERPTDDATRDAVEQSAEAAGAFEELVALYKEHLSAFEGGERVEMESHIAQISLERLGDLDSAVEGYLAILEERPDDQTALKALDDIFRTTGRWDELVDIYRRKIALTEDVESKRNLTMEMAQVYEDGMDDVSNAAAQYRSVLEMVPGDMDALMSLERIFRQAGQWGDLVEILQRRRGLADVGSDDWREISFVVATLLDEQLEEKPTAIAIFKELLETQPGDQRAIEGIERYLREESYRSDVAGFLEQHLVISEDWRRLAWVLAILVESAGDPARRLELNTRLAEVYGEKLGDQRVAFDTLGAALRENPGDTDLWDRMTELAVALDLLADLAARLGEAYTSGALDDEKSVDLARRLADLLDEQLGQPAEAEVYHRKVLAWDPTTEASFRSLEELYTGGERWDDLLELYRGALDRETGGAERLDLLLKICFIVDEVNHDVPLAIDSYRQVMEVEPGNREALRALTSLYEEAERWEDLSSLLRDQLTSAEGEEVIQLQYRLGEIAEHFLKQPDSAIEQYEMVMSEDPDHLKAQEALERLLEMPELRQRAARVLEKTYDLQGAAEPLARVLMIELEDEELPVPEQVEIITRVADLRERRLGDANGAFTALSNAFKLEPSNEMVAGEIERIADENGLQSEYCDLLDSVIPDVLDNTILAAKLMTDVARLYDERLGNLEKAEVAYRRLLDNDPDNPETALPAVEALDRLLTASESWDDLLAVLRVRVKLIGDPDEQKEVLHRMAELEESLLDRPHKAIEVYREVLDIDDTDLRALSGLERLYEREENWPELIEILRRRALGEDSSDMRRDIYLRVARLFEEQLDDREEAIAAFTQVTDEVGPDRDAHQALARLYEAAERWRDLLDIYEAEEPLVDDPQERAQMLYRMGDLLRARLDEPERAVERLGETLAIDQQHAEARASLEAMLDSPVKLEAIRILRPIFEGEGDFERLLRFSEIQAQEADDPLERSQVFREAAEVAEVGLDDQQRAFELLGRAFRDGTASPDLPRVIDDLERLAALVEGYQVLVGLYREVGPDILDGDLQVRCNLRAADIAYNILEDFDVAREYYVKVLDMDGENAEAMTALERIYEAGELYLELFDIYRRKVQIAYDESERRDILFKQARVCELNLDDVSGATQTYETILDSDPTNAEAMEALERLYPKSERWADLMDLLDRRVELQPDGQVDLLHRLGSLAEDKLGDYERALDYLSRALEADPNHVETLSALEAAMDDDARRGRVAEILEPVYKQRGDWSKLAGALDARLEFCDDPLERKELLGQIGTVYEEQLGDLDRAFDTFARLFSEDIEDRNSWDLLTRLGSVLEAWEKLASVFAAALEDVVGDTPNTAELAFMLGDIYESRLEKPEEAKAAYQRVLAFSPDDPKAFSAVERMLLATESWSDLLELYRDAADAALEMDNRKQFLFKIADIQESAMEDHDAAINAFRDVLDIDDRDQQGITSLDRLYFQAERFEDLTVHLRTQIDQEPDTEQRNELRRRLASVFEENLEDNTSAVDVYEEALSEEGGDPRSLAELERLILDDDQRQRIADILEPIYRDVDEWKKLVVILGTQNDYIDAPAQKVEKLREIAGLHENRGGNFLLAFDALKSAFQTDASEREVLADLVRLAESIENWEDLTKTIEDQLDEIYDMDFKMEVLHLLGVTQDRRLDNPRKAIEAYRAIIEINETDAKALDALEGLFNLVGDWDGLVEVLSRKADLADEPSARAELLRTKASIHEDLMAAPKDAIDAYRGALDAEPTSTAAMDALERLYEGAEEWIEYIEIRRTRLDVVEEPEERLEVLRSIAAVHEDKLEDAFEAIACWRTVLEEDGHDAAAIAALDKLYTRESMYTELLENLTLQKEITQDQALWVDIGVRIGELQEKEIADLAGAVESYRDVLAQQPTHAGAIEALERLAQDESVRALAVEVIEPLHREASRFDSLAQILELKLQILDDPAERFAELLGLAELHEVGRSDPSDAFDVYARALAEDPARSEVMEAMERIAGAEGMWEKLADVYQAQSADVYEPEVERGLLGRLGEIREVHLSDAAGAIDAYRRVLDSGAADEQILSALDRLYEREQKWAELDEVLEQEIGIAADMAEINQLKLRQAGIREREFGDVAGAIMAYRDVVEASPDNTEAVAALEGLLVKDEFVQDIVEVLTPVYEVRDEKEKIGRLFEHRLRVAGNDDDKVDLYRELAEHQEQVLGDPSPAFDAYAKAFALAPEHADLLEQLERLANELGSWASLLEVTEQVLEGGRLDPSAEVELGLKVAGWASTHVGDPRMAETRYRAVLEREPEHPEALVALVDLLQSLGRFEDLLPVLAQQADVTHDFTEKKEILFRIAQIARFELGNAERAAEAYRDVLSIDDADLDSLDALIGLSEEGGDFAALVDLLLSRAQYTNEPTEAAGFRHRAATLYVGPLEDPARAVDVYREILDMDPIDGNAISQLETLYQQLERWEDLKDLFLQRLDNAAGDENRAAILGLLADLAEQRFEDYDEAAEYLNEVVMIAPFDEQASTGLERLYTKTERWQDLVELLEGRADRERDAGDTNAELTLLVRVGEIWDGQLADPDQAVGIYERVLERDPEHTRALAALARLYEANEDWERCAEVLRKAAAAGRGGEDEAEVHYRLARLHESQLDDAEGALAELRQAVELHPGHAEANAALVDRCREIGDNQGLLEALMRQEIYLEEDAEKVAKLLEIADLQAGPLTDPHGAVASLERARELDPKSKDVLLKLSDGYIEAGRQDDAIPVIESLIDVETQGGKKRSKGAAVFHQQLAKAYMSRGETDRALENLEAAYKMDISNTEVLISLGRLHYDREDFDKAVKLFRALLLQRFDSSAGATKADIYWYVGDICLKQNDTRKAKGMFQRGLDEDPNHDGCKAGLAQC
jgi:tetratricopeptide (TPR) repeat protein